MSFEQRLQRFDALYGLPRRADEPHLPAYHAFVRCAQDAAQLCACLGAGLLAALCFGGAAYYLAGGWVVTLLCGALMLLAALTGLAEAARQLLPYYEFNRLLTYGTAHWATPRTLQAAGLAHPLRATLPHGALPLGTLPCPLRRPWRLALPLDLALGSLVFFGPPRAGKSVLLMHYLHALAAAGWSALIIDPKGELYQFCAPHFRQLYRLDFAQPEYSDRWNFLPQCRGNKEFAHQMATLMLGLETAQTSHSDPFWRESELALLTAILLYLPRVIAQPTPALVHEFIALRSFDELCQELGSCPDHEVQVQWGTFTKAPEQTRGSVFTGLAAKINPFTIDAARAVTAPLTDAERARGAREIDLTDLRQPGTGLFVVIPEGAAARYQVPLATFLGQAVEHLRERPAHADTTPVMFVVDEAAHIPIANLKEIPGVGRGRKFAVMLFYQNLSQGLQLYGEHGFHAILGSVNTKTFLPGCDLITARYAAELVGQTTVWGRAYDDAPGTQYDKTRTTEAARPLLDAAEVRQLLVHRQAVSVIETLPPIKWSYPPPAHTGPRCQPRRYGVPQSINLRAALAAPPVPPAALPEASLSERAQVVMPAVTESAPRESIAGAALCSMLAEADLAALCDAAPEANLLTRETVEPIIRQYTGEALDQLLGLSDSAAWDD